MQRSRGTGGWGLSMLPSPLLHMPPPTRSWPRSLAVTLAPARIPGPSPLTCSHPGPGSTNISLCLLRVLPPPGFSLGTPVILITRYSISQEVLAPTGQHFGRHTSRRSLVLCCALLASTTNRQSHLCPNQGPRAQPPVAHGRNRATVVTC